VKAVFADSLYWIAIVRPKDPWKEKALQARSRLGEVALVTTDEVLNEFLAALCKGGPKLRRAAVEMVHAILNSPEVTVLPQTHQGFLDGVERYGKREDKEYSLTDCISMNAMNAEGLHEVLTNDHHFEQESFTVLIR
jgi:predicted nucleic acid-binding protein